MPADHMYEQNLSLRATPGFCFPSTPINRRPMRSEISGNEINFAWTVKPTNLFGLRINKNQTK